MDDLKFERLTVEKGLSQSVIYKIIQDKEGFLWFGTQDGVNRFDGYNFKIYKNKRGDVNSIADNYVASIYADSDGITWFGGMNDNLSFYHKGKDQFENFNLDEDGENIKSSLVTSIIEDCEGNLLVGTFDGGLKKFNKKNHSVKHYLNNPDSGTIFSPADVSCLLKDSDENIWIGTWTEGLFILDKGKNIFTNFKDMFPESDTLSPKKIYCLMEDTKKNIWIGTSNGLIFYDRFNHIVKKNFYNSDEKQILQTCKVSSVAEDKNQNIWIGTKNSGLYRIDIQGNETNYKFNQSDLSSISSNSIYTLYNDNSNVLWIGTKNFGICKLDCERKNFSNISRVKSESKEYSLNNVTSVYSSHSGKLYIGTSGKGLFTFEKNESLSLNNFKTVFQSVQILNKQISGITEDHNNDIWLTMFSGNELIKFTKSNNTFKSFFHNSNEGIHSLARYKKTLLLGSVNNGIIGFYTGSEKFESPELEINLLSKITCDRIFCLLIDSKKILWIGTQNEGLYKYDIEKNIYSNYRKSEDDNESISENFIISLFQDSKENLWIGTYSGPLNKLDPDTGKFVKYNTANGIHENIIGILEDENYNLWLCTNFGLQKFNHREAKIQNYDFTNEIQSNEFHYGANSKDKDGTMYFGGINGVTYFKPEEIKDNPYIPNVVITDFEIFNEPVTGSPENPFLKKNITYADEINLTYKESVFSFRFAALIFNNPQKNQYAYKMEGFDKDWTYCGDRKRVTYTNLNPGDYTFRVKGSNNDGIWNEEGTSIKINITPPYWKTWWFKSLGFLGVIAATGYQYRQRLEKLEKESKAQEEFSRKLIESQENERKRIAHSLHDTIAHEVTISKNKAMMALKHKDDPEFMQRALEEISEMASSTISDVRNISYDLHPHQLERLGFTKAIRSIINDVSKSTNISFKLESDNVDEILSKESEINLFRVIQESITNIIKHSMATEAVLRVSNLEDCLLIVIIDNGKGFDVNSKEFIEAKHGFGIEGILERVKFMSGEIKVESEINKGTTLRFKIPIKK